MKRDCETSRPELMNEMTEGLQCCRHHEEAYKALNRILPADFS
jgi:hypothetical protein